MQKHSFNIPRNSSISLNSALRRSTLHMRSTTALLAAGLQAATAEKVVKGDLTTLLVEIDENGAADTVLAAVPIAGEEELEKLSDKILSASVTLTTAERLLKTPHVQRVQTKKRNISHLTEACADIGLAPVAGARPVAETGDGVFIGIVDSGFDLSHPMFLDAQGQLRVAGLLDQRTNLAFQPAALQVGWAVGGNKPGADGHGHGTHVASIAGGSRWQNREGIAPGAQFLLVRTDFINTDKAVKWIFDQAGTKPCVVNLSLGHHWGAHDGSDVQERFYESIVGKGKIIVASAGNERNDAIHIGGLFFPMQTETVPFDVLRPQDRNANPFAVLTLWYDPRDDFDITLVSPTGQELDVPALNKTDSYQANMIEIELSRKGYAPTNLTQVQIALAFTDPDVPNRSLRGWRIRLTCKTVVVGRLDGWMNNSGVAEFQTHRLVESARTVGLPATSAGCLTVASHVSKNTWDSDVGAQSDIQAVIGRSSTFSSKGPTRDGRSKPDISAPGQYMTAALATDSALAREDRRTRTALRLLTIEGTSMSAPVVTGAVALLLQRKKALTVDKVLQALRESARRDAHTGLTWNPRYGHGKLDIVKALSLL